MTPNDRIAPTIAVLLACLATSGHAGDWTTANHIASTRAIETSDGADARLEVQCGPEREVRLLHEALDAVPAETDKNPRYDGTVAVSGGWGLDLRRPENRGARTRWRRCAGTPGCLRARHRLDHQAAEEERDLAPAGEARGPAPGGHEVRSRRIGEGHRSSVPSRGPAAAVTEPFTEAELEERARIIIGANL